MASRLGQTRLFLAPTSGSSPRILDPRTQPAWWGFSRVMCWYTAQCSRLIRTFMLAVCLEDPKMEYEHKYCSQIGCTKLVYWRNRMKASSGLPCLSVSFYYQNPGICFGNLSGIGGGETKKRNFQIVRSLKPNDVVAVRCEYYYDAGKGSCCAYGVNYSVAIVGNRSVTLRRESGNVRHVGVGMCSATCHPKSLIITKVNGSVRGIKP
jgi:hypothetical protein